jgi:hypothetical protein
MIRAAAFGSILSLAASSFVSAGLAATVPGGGTPSPGAGKPVCSAPNLPAVGQTGTLSFNDGWSSGSVSVANTQPMKFTLPPSNGTMKLKKSKHPTATFTGTLFNCSVVWTFVNPEITPTPIGGNPFLFTYDSVSHTATAIP